MNQLSKSEKIHQFIYKSTHGTKSFDIVSVVTGEYCSGCFEETTEHEQVYETTMRFDDFIPTTMESTQPWYICQICARRYVEKNPAVEVSKESAAHVPKDIANIIALYYGAE